LLAATQAGTRHHLLLQLQAVPGPVHVCRYKELKKHLKSIKKQQEGAPEGGQQGQSAAAAAAASAAAMAVQHQQDHPEAEAQPGQVSCGTYWELSNRGRLSIVRHTLLLICHSTSFVCLAAGLGRCTALCTACCWQPSVIVFQLYKAAVDSTGSSRSLAHAWVQQWGGAQGCIWL